MVFDICFQDLSRRQPDLIDKGVHGYKGNPHDFDPHRSRTYDMYARGGPEGGALHRPMAAPPPAHCHHSSSSVAQPEALSMKNPRRPDSRNKSPSMYQGDPRGGGGVPPSGSPFAGMDPAARHSPAARIPPPPPLITSGAPKTPPKMSRSPPSSSSSAAAAAAASAAAMGQHGHMMVPPGSITHGTPVSHPQVIPPASHPSAMVRRMEALPHQSANTPPTSAPQSARMEGSITKGTPMQGRGGPGEGGGRMVLDPSYQGRWSWWIFFLISCGYLANVTGSGGG